MANYFGTVKEWSGNSSVYPQFDYLVVIPDNFIGTSGVFPFKISDGITPANRLPFAPNSAPFTLPGSSGGSVSITNVPLPITSTDLNLEATQQEVKTAVEKFQFDALGNLKTTGGGGGGGDATAANQVIGNASLASIDGKLTNPLPVSIPGAIAVTGPLTDAQLRATPVPVSGTVTTGGLTDAQLRATPVPVSAASLPLPTGAATEATLSTLTGKIPASLTVVGTALKVDGSAVTQPVSGPLTDAQLRATPVPVSGTVSTGGLTDAELRASAVPVSLASVPLPTGAATEATLSALNTKVTAVNTGAVVVSSSALPTGAATAALQTQPGIDIGDVTVNNAAGASAVNVQDGGNSLTVDAPVATPVFVRLSDGAAAITTLPVSVATAPVLVAGTAIIGKVGIDQTTPGTTNNVEVSKLPKASSANTPSILVAGGDVIALNTSRKAWGIQNLGTNTLFVRMATGASSSVFHFALAPGSVADDGLGGSVMDDIYTGVVSATGTSPRFTTFEL